jgi:transmembrane sensor
MSEIVKLRTRAEIDEEAAQWTWRMDGEVTPAEQQAFDAWLRQDPRHRRAMDELSRVWQTLDGLAEAKRGEKIATFTEQPTSAHQAATRRNWLIGAAAAAMVAVAVGLGFVLIGQRSETQTLATAVGQERTVTLADGSIITLNTNSIVETVLTGRLRQIYLRKGEAHFQVAHDTSRPFLVHAGDAVVRAVGTEFEVRLLTDQHVDVTVNEGRVEVQAGPAQPATRRALNAGQKLATTDYSVKQVSPEQLSSQLAWREGAIVFDGEPLAEAIAEIQRYTDARIIISDGSTALLRVGGRFRTGDVQGFFAGLESALPVSIRRSADGVVYVDPRR